jgi:hypothetical protein
VGGFAVRRDTGFRMIARIWGRTSLSAEPRTPGRTEETRRSD